MLYLGIDQHARQITISLRDENGDVLRLDRFRRSPRRSTPFFSNSPAERLQTDENRSSPCWKSVASTNG